jgi:two-component system, chemotaxis family, CheB/CheR fusion protein
VPQQTDAAFERLLDYVRDNRGFDFTGYKRPSLTRRVRKRMQEVGITEFGEYQDHLEVHPDEFTQLFNTILINVTSFFRDAQAWEYIGAEILPAIIDRRSDHEHIRVWSIGCASGEEAYSIAMLLAEAVSLSKMLERVKIYATDVDEEALAQARLGVYGEKALQAIPTELRAKYLEPTDNGSAFRKEIRRAVIFGRHDLVKDAPISRVDLIVCRNTLMYFNAETQTRIYNGFHFALRPEGFLFVGKSEMLLTRASIFQPVDLKRRVFVRVSKDGDDDIRREELRTALASPRGNALRDAVFESATVAQILIDRDGALIAANSHARSEFRLAEADFGRPFYELELSYRPVELRSRIERALSERRSNSERAVPWTGLGGDERRFDVEVVPLHRDRDVLGTMITFTDVTRSYELQNELEISRRELETAYEEIQSTVEELETTNEELQSTNEELETTNEELQSTNEELETMNEELHSTNEELETLNDELRERTMQLNQANAFLESVLEGVRAGVVALDASFNVESWNTLAEDLWGLRSDEVVGTSLFALDFGLPVEQLKQPIKRVADGSSEFGVVTLEATNRRGKSFRCRVLVSRFSADGGDGPSGVILLMEPED